MSFFKKKNNYFTAATIITKGTTLVGDLIGDDSVHIDGHVQGDIKVNNVIIIGKDGEVHGNIKAKHIICNGKIKGDVLCDNVEMLEHASAHCHIKANKMLLKGSCKGNILCSGLFVAQEGLLEANVEAKNVVAGGTVIATIACLALKIPKTGQLKGKIFANRIINEGGHVEGFIGKFHDFMMQNPQLQHYSNIFKASKDIALLEDKDYLVDVKREIKNSKKPSNQKKHLFLDVTFEDSDHIPLRKVS